MRSVTSSRTSAASNGRPDAVVRVVHPQHAHMTLGAVVFHGQELGVETSQLSHASIVVQRRRVCACLCCANGALRRCRISTPAATCGDSVRGMEPAWVGAQGEHERRLWSTVLQTSGR